MIHTLTVVIPIYNEANFIGRVVEELKTEGITVIVIDDGSTDNSAEIAKEAGAIVFRNPKKSGKGSTLKRGFKEAITLGYKGIIAMDGDGQHAPSDLGRFISIAKHDEISIITGNRMNDVKQMPKVRIWTNRFMSSLISLACKQHIPDTQCGYRYISTDILKNIDLASNEFEIETEILMKAAKKGYKIHSVPIKTIYSNEKSKINPFKDTIRFFSYFIKEVFQ